jgi:hypothetical protein
MQVSRQLVVASTAWAVIWAPPPSPSLFDSALMSSQVKKKVVGKQVKIQDAKALVNKNEKKKLKTTIYKQFPNGDQAKTSKKQAEK